MSINHASQLAYREPCTRKFEVDLRGRDLLCPVVADEKVHEAVQEQVLTQLLDHVASLLSEPPHGAEDANSRL